MRTRRRRVHGLLGSGATWAALLAAQPAAASTPATSSSSTTASAPVSAPTSAEPGSSEGLDPDRFEFGLLPALNYNSDLGVGFGAVGTLVEFAEGYNPYKWRVQATIFFSMRDQGSGLEIPLQSHSLELDQPGLLKGDLRLRFRLAFNRQSNTGYYGLGSNAPDESSPPDVDPTRTQYDRVFPEVVGTARIRLWSEPVSVGKRRLELFVGTSFRYTWFDLFEDSRLALDAEQARLEGGRLSELLVGVEDHALWMVQAGLLWDTRDREFDPHRGAFHELSVRASPGIDASLDFLGFALIARFFIPIIRDRLVLATRTAADMLLGDAPVYELSNFGAFEPESAPGGGRSLRGVPLQRFHGKLKLLQSLELRGRIVPFRIATQRFMLGAAAFVDAGRVWADFEGGRVDVRQVDGTVTRRRLDDDLAAFELGVGAGARIRWGETFIIRVDFAYSPTLDTLGFYIDIGDAF